MIESDDRRERFAERIATGGAASIHK